MGLNWSLADEEHNGTPAAHWWQTLFVGEDDTENDGIRFLQFMSCQNAGPGRNAFAVNALGNDPMARLALGNDAFKQELIDTYGDCLRVPISDERILTNPAGVPTFEVQTDKMSIPPEGSVLVGVIDDAIGFANKRFRSDLHKSRFLYLWQQNQIIDEKGEAAVPIGREYLEGDLNAALATDLSEIEIYRNLGMIREDRREFLAHASHGTSVADRAAGAEMGSMLGDKTGEQVRILGVNLPLGIVADAAGTYLEFFASLGLTRMMEHINALEERASLVAGRSVSYPVIINFSFGLSSGPPDPNGLFASQIDAIHEARAKAGKEPLTYMVPAGNQRKARTLGRLPQIPAGSEETFTLRVPIYSATSTIVEITTESGLEDLQADLIAPASLGVPESKIDLAKGQYCTLHNTGDPVTPMAAVYKTKRKLMLMIAPTRLRQDAHFVVAQPGHWTVRLRAGKPVAGLRAQIHRGDTPGAQFYKGYQTRFLDREVPGDPPERFIQEKGTLNTLAGAETATIVQAVRGGSNEITDYTGEENKEKHPVKGTFTKEVAELVPSRDGRISSGIRSGTTARLGGTSIAAAIATRSKATGVPDEPRGDVDLLP